MSTRTGIAWYVNRLRVMGPREILHRVREQIDMRRLDDGRRPRSLDPERIAFFASATPVLDPIDWDDVALEREATNLLAGCCSALGADWQWEQSGRCWHTAPDTGAMWPRVHFARVDHRQGNPYGDARRIWEPARLQHLVALARLASDPARRAPALAMIANQLESWLDANPPFQGVHYISAMECALRLIAVCHTLDLLRGDLALPAALLARIAGLIESHAKLVHRRPSLHSSAGNHTIAEAVALLYASLLLPELSNAAECKALGLDLLARECPRQILPDGGSLEQSSAYLRFVAELCQLAISLLRRNGHNTASFESRVQRAHAFLAALGPFAKRANGPGDCDDGHALSPFARRASPARDSPRRLRTFAETGVSVLRGAHDTRIVLDHGDLGMAPLYGHGHADALSVLVSRGNVPLISDSGTFTYTGEPRWRAYFRSTPAHNTVTVDDADQAEQRTPFAWDRPFFANLVRTTCGSSTALLAVHDGYRRIGVRHWRALIYDHADRIVVWDYLIGDGEHRLDLWWHFDTGVRLEDGGVRAIPGERFISLALEGAQHVDLFSGSEAPLAGWCAPRYGCRTPRHSVRARFEGALPRELVTLIGLSPRSAQHEPTARELSQIEQLRRVASGH